MARPLRVQFPGAFYHVLCRGNKGTNVFLDDDDRRRFLFLLSESLEVYDVILYAYVLMQNHFHLIVQTQRPNLSEFMRRFNICYTGWFNYHHGSYGHLYQGRYKSLLIDADKYLLVLSRYIHLNPVRLRRRPTTYNRSSWRTLRQYDWSSLPGYIDGTMTVDFVSYDTILDMIGGRKAYRRFMAEGLQRDLKNPFDDVKFQMILGSDSFLRHIKDKYAESGSSREQPAYKHIRKHAIDPESIIKCVTVHFGLSRDKLIGSRKNGIARAMASELLYRYSALKLQEIGKILGIDYSSVGKSRHRLKATMLQNKCTAEVYLTLEQKIKDSLSNVEI